MYWGQTFYIWWFWRAKRVGQPHKFCNCDHQIPRHSKRSALFTTSMARGWILFFAMKTLRSYIILVGIFYQLLIQTFSFSSKIHLIIDNMSITTHLIMMFFPSIVHIINWYFEFINPSWLLNSKRQQPRRNLLKIYRKQFYGQKNIKKFFPTNNQFLEKTDEATCPMTTGQKEINWYLLSNLRCYLTQKKNRRKTKFESDSFKICANSGASYCATPDEIYFIPGTYKHLTGVKISGISKGIKVAGCRPGSWIFKMTRRRILKWLLNAFYIF